MIHKDKINQENDAAYSADFFCPEVKLSQG